MHYKLLVLAVTLAVNAASATTVAEANAQLTKMDVPMSAAQCQSFGMIALNAEADVNSRIMAASTIKELDALEGEKALSVRMLKIYKRRCKGR